MSDKSPKLTTMTDESMLISPEMVDLDMGSIEQRFHANASIVEGVSGCKPIDTLFENTSLPDVESPRSGSTPTPESQNPGMYPHRGL